MADEVEIEAYDPAWPALFADEREKLASVLPQADIVAIEHAGSTSIAGLGAKPIIDIFIAVRSIAKARSHLVAPVCALGYVFWEDNPDPDALFFVKGMPPFGSRRTHHVHMLLPENARWKRALLFRDYLRSHPDTAQTYLALKHDLACQHRNDREAYTRAKDDFITEIVARARRSA